MTSALELTREPTREQRQAGIWRASRALLAALPQGHLLPDHPWRARHRWIVGLLWIHAFALVAFAVARGYDPLHSVLESAILVAAAVVASLQPLGRRARSLAASFGMVTASALLVHFWGGTVEAHFHFFVVVPILILYQDWAVFLLALFYVVVHHGLMGALDPGSVYNHPAAVAHPWVWALIHGGFVLAASAASVVSWRASEEMLCEPLTRLPGRAAFLHRVTLALDRVRRRGARVAVIFIDLDRFKALNDTLGHAVGDELLVAAARRLTTCVRRGDTVARVGGDEFAVLCEDVAGEGQALAIAARIRRALGEPFPTQHSEVVLGASIGIALTDTAATSADRLVADADIALYRAKARRGDRYVLFDEAMRAQDANRLEIETQLRQAMERDELHLVYQPIVSIEDGEPVAVEALLRWSHPTRGPVSPAEFIPVAEQTGLIVPIGRWVLENACREAMRWPEDGHRPAPYVSVNLSGRQLAEADLLATIVDVLDRTGIPPARLGLEVTESMLMDELEAPLETLRALKTLGVRLLLDDFGTGYSSLSYLKRFPIDVVKIDRSFVAGLENEPDDEAILAAVTTMAAALGIAVVAEGVETEAQATRLTALGCRHAQGYYFARPAPAAELELLHSEPIAPPVGA